jgi:hypothetical protein
VLASAPAAAQTGTASAATPAPLVLVGPAKARVDSARLPYTEADVRFMTHMIGHHAQAIEMSRLAPTRSASPAVRTLAERIINAQHDEIAIMQQWLRDRGRPAPDPVGDAAGHAAHGPAGAHAAHGTAGATAAPATAGHAHHGDAAAMPGCSPPRSSPRSSARAAATSTGSSCSR